MAASYDHYVKDDRFLADYNSFQAEFSDNIRHRDQVIIDVVGERTKGEGSLLDIGCSTGNLLAYLAERYPSLKLTGGDLAQSSVEEARKQPKLKNADLQIMDITKVRGRYDCIVACAVAIYLTWQEYAVAMRGIADALNKGGTYIAFEWLHPYELQDITLTERTPSHPEGLPLHSRPFGRTKAALIDAGFSEVEFRPFVLPYDLPFRGYDDIGTHSYTRKDERGERMCFRGSLYQPWCHMIATK